MQRPSFSKFSRTDWHGDSIVVMVLGALLLVSLFLPWANERDYPRQNFTYALTTSGDINPILQTPWGWPIAISGAVVVVLGVTMLAFGPRRWTGGPIAIVLAGVAMYVLYDVDQAAHPAWGWGYSVGLGALVALIVGILLPIVALATALTSRILRDLEAERAAETAADAAPTPTAP